ncbi:MAG TPA: YggS family pyridoxal phosphate-dependent enzyme, partial [Planctomycetaceae bacterium]|nr:YggS family pyridoxal phosphate-dependent enzyme [Planctomycetaceae bacterium]
MTTIANRIADNLARVRARISQACQRAGRDSDDVTLVCVTKYAQPEWIDGLLECGELVLGENRPQQLEQRASRFSDRIQWHLIGQLQRNKVRRTLAVASMIHSVDSMKLLERI